MTDRPERRTISSGRKGLYYGGMLLMVLGVLTFLSGMLVMMESGPSLFSTGPRPGSVSFEEQRKNFDDQFTAAKDRGTSMMIRAVIGMVMIAGGAMMKSVGQRGAAGAGLILDPERARSELEPWARMGGGLANDALDEVDIVHSLKRNLETKGEAAEVKVRCQSCRGLNDEDAKFCDQCGAPL